eukprot:2116674-Amphidinium_carterae.2
MAAMQTRTHTKYGALPHYYIAMMMVIRARETKLAGSIQMHFDVLPLRQYSALVQHGSRKDICCGELSQEYERALELARTGSKVTESMGDGDMRRIEKLVESTKWLMKHNMTKLLEAHHGATASYHYFCDWTPLRAR